MSTRDILLPAVSAQLASIGRADFVVGIPSYQNARTIGHVVQAAQTGLAKYFPDARAVVLNSDGGSTDGTPAVVASAVEPDGSLILLSQPSRPAFRFSVPYHGIPGKGSAFRTIFAAAECLEARACVVVDADLRSITPEWIHLLLGPVDSHGFDYVAPYYQRHKFDGTITNSVVYPLTRALYGQRIRQPIGGDFGVSSKLFRHFLTLPVWDTDVARYGIDIWMTTTAVCGGFSVCQSYLGAKLHDAKDPGADLSAMLVQVLGTVFRLMETHEAQWQTIVSTRDVPLFGFRYDVGLDPVRVNVSRMIEHYRRGVAELMDLWQAVFQPADRASLLAAAVRDEKAFSLDDELWVRLVYDLATAFHHRVMDRDILLRAALPLYMGRVASFVLEMCDAQAADVDARIERLCQSFEDQKDDLRRRWTETRQAR
jgi:glucosylglycerate synthase